MNTKNKQVVHKYKKLLRIKEFELSIFPLTRHFAKPMLGAVIIAICLLNQYLYTICKLYE